VGSLDAIIGLSAATANSKPRQSVAVRAKQSPRQILVAIAAAVVFFKLVW
jgi:hypothetical protein